MTSYQRPIVVGVDASPDSHAALRWAVADARLSNRPIRVVYVYPSLEVGGPQQHIATAPELTSENAFPHAQHFVEQVIAGMQLPRDEVSISGIAVAGRPDKVLCAESERAELMVVGSRKLGAVGSYLLGSVGQAVATGAHCPTVVVRSEPAEVDQPEIVVGLTADASAEQVLAFAFEQASWRGARLKVVHGWRSPIGPHTTLFPVEFSEPDIDELSQESARLDLAELVAGWQEKFPDVPVTDVVRYGHPASLLLEESVGTQLLIVGNSTHRPLAGTFFGSVCLSVLHHAACPVAVVPLAR